jgi:hypothetical protein
MAPRVFRRRLKELFTKHIDDFSEQPWPVRREIQYVVLLGSDRAPDEPPVSLFDSSGFAQVNTKDHVARTVSTPLYQWPGGTRASVKRKCTNDASTSGTQSIKLEPAVGSPVQLITASVINRDAVSRTIEVALHTSGGNLVNLLNQSSAGQAPCSCR